MTYNPASAASTADLLASGEETYSRRLVNSTASMTSGRLFLSYFTARKTETVTQMRTITGGTAAGATPTLCRVGLYSISSAGAGSLVASSANSTSLWNAANTAFTSTFSSSYSKVAGQRYAVALIIVTAAAVPNLAAAGVDIANGLRNEFGLAPRIAGFLGSQTDLPASFTDASLTNMDWPYYSAIIP